MTIRSRIKMIEKRHAPPPNLSDVPDDELEAMLLNSMELIQANEPSVPDWFREEIEHLKSLDLPEPSARSIAASKNNEQSSYAYRNITVEDVYNSGLEWTCSERKKQNPVWPDKN